ncbi:MAG: hypothetical protein HFJ17_00085 [Clostridia bacterium]|nr:hypothetical protein [Clostridia bacterium]
MKKLKLISTILLSLMLMFTISTAVFADNEVDDNFWSDNVPVVGEGTTNSTENDTLNETTTNNTVSNDFEDANEMESEIENIEDNYTENSSTTNSNSLAYTGIGDSNGMIALMLIVSAIIAIYSAKKFSDYRNI